MIHSIQGEHFASPHTALSKRYPRSTLCGEELKNISVSGIKV